MFTKGFSKIASKESDLAYIKTWPKDSYAIGGSGILEAHGVRPANDYDVNVTKDLFEALHKKHKKPISAAHLGARTMKLSPTLEVFDGIKGISTKELIRSARHIDGANYFSPKHVIKMKRMLGRPKDRADIEVLKKLK